MFFLAFCSLRLQLVMHQLLLLHLPLPRTLPPPQRASPNPQRPLHPQQAPLCAAAALPRVHAGPSQSDTTAPGRRGGPPARTGPGRPPPAPSRSTSRPTSSPEGTCCSSIACPPAGRRRIPRLRRPARRRRSSSGTGIGRNTSISKS